MTDVTNLYPNPDLRTTVGTGMVMGNYFPNPSPKVDLTGWTAVSGGSVTRTTAAALFPGDTTYGCRVTSGLNLTLLPSPGVGPTVTAKVKASAAMDITVDVSAEYKVYVESVGWGDFGWGKTKTFVPGATKTFTSGEECLFRIYFRPWNGTPGTPPNYPMDGTDWHPVVTLTSSSTSDTFDVDGVVQWVGVNDGDSTGYIPDAPLYFSGDTPADGTFTYSWYGTPNASPSVQTAAIPKYTDSTYLYSFDPIAVIPHGNFAVTVGGEHRVAWRSAIGFGQQDLKFTGVTYTAGKNYVVSYDVIEDYQFYHSGYEEPVFEGAWYPTIYDNHLGYNQRVNQHYVSGKWPYRKRTFVPFAMTTGMTPWASLASSQDWLTGDVHVTNVAVNEIANIYHNTDLNLTSTGIQDLMALGLTAGGEYTLAFETFDTPTPTCYVEYTTDGSTWTTLATVGGMAGLTGDEKIDSYNAQFTIPSSATGTRLRMSAGGWLYQFDLFDSPPPYFNGSTPAGGGYTYSWAGTPYDSPSIRSVATTSGPEAKVFIGGTAVAATEIRIQTGGSLNTVTDLRGA
jgi:hypothetical protein